MNEAKIYRVARTDDRNKAEWLTDFTFPWLDRDTPETRFRAWHNGVKLFFEFQVEDHDLVIDESEDDHQKVLGSDRVELFVSPTAELTEPYYGFEMDPRGLVYDYKGVFHRKFDPSWRLASLSTSGSITPRGYDLEGAFPLADLVELNCLKGNQMITGVYRGEFGHRSDGSVQQDWISWVDPATPTPDFHVPESFGRFIFEGLS